jgi:hypothetical protein
MTIGVDVVLGWHGQDTASPSPWVARASRVTIFPSTRRYSIRASHGACGPFPVIRSSGRPRHGVAVDPHVLLEDAHHRVVLQEVGELVVVEEVVDGDDLDVFPVADDAVDGPADAAEAVDRDAAHREASRSSVSKRSRSSTARWA